MSALFSSFFFGGFEGTTAWIEHKWTDAVKATGHDERAGEDYELLRAHGIGAVRETIPWAIVEARPGKYCFDRVLPFVRAARHHGIEVLWDLFHFGYPSHLHPLQEDFADRFAEYCLASARFLAGQMDGPFFFAPVNEPSFFSFIAGHVGKFAPYLTDSGWFMKVALAGAAIQGVNALRSVFPECCIVSIDPICRVAAPRNGSAEDECISDFNDRLVFQSWDMIAGDLCPELGGSKEHLGIVGVNYYWTNQWEFGTPSAWLEEDDDRYTPLSSLVRTVWERYGTDVLITETSHVNEHRPAWLWTLARESAVCMLEGLPLRGVCIFPIIGMFDWYDQERFIPFGLWDIEHTNLSMRRVPHYEALNTFKGLSRSGFDGITRMPRPTVSGKAALEAESANILSASFQSRG